MNRSIASALALVACLIGTAAFAQEPAPRASASKAAAAAPVNINTASASDLQRLPGAGGIASFDADGSASSGSLYLTDGRTQVAVTVTPATGRVRARQWDRRVRQWRQIR